MARKLSLTSITVFNLNYMSNGTSYIHMMASLIRLVRFRCYHKSFIFIRFPTFSTITGDTNIATTGVQITGQPQHFTKFHSTTTTTTTTTTALTFQPTQRKQTRTVRATPTLPRIREAKCQVPTATARCLRRRPLPSTVCSCTSTRQSTCGYVSENETIGHWYTAYKLKDNIRLTVSCRTGCAFLSNSKYILYLIAIYS